MDADALAARFEAERDSLTGLAYRLLGSRPAAEDAVQDAWLRLARTDPAGIDNLGGWLRTVVTRLCLDQLRATARYETPGSAPDRPSGPDPAELVELADDVSRVLLVVLGTLGPAERVAVVLHDMFAVPFPGIGRLIGRSTEATKKLTQRARTRLRGAPARPPDELRRHRAAVARFLDAARTGEVDRVLAVLDPDVVRTADAAALPPGMPATVRGAGEVAAGTALLAERSRRAELALLDGDVGLVVVEHGRVALAVTFTVVGDLIAGYHVIADPRRLAGLRIALPPDQSDGVASR